MSLPIVTAAITAYNAEATVMRALASALNQDWPTLEILVVDDASSDGTVALIEGFIREHATEARPIRLLRQPFNGGVARARNRLVEEACGEFIAFFDDDDISAPDRVSRQHARIAETEAALGHDLVLCHTARVQEFPDGRLHYEGTMGCEHQVVPFGSAVVDRILLGRLSPGVIGSCATCSQMGRKSVYRRLGGFDPTLPRSEDTDLNIRCAYQGGAFAGLAAPLVRQTMTSGSEKKPGGRIGRVCRTADQASRLPFETRLVGILSRVATGAPPTFESLHRSSPRSSGQIGPQASDKAD